MILGKDWPKGSYEGSFQGSNRAICVEGELKSGPITPLPIEGVFDCRPLLDSEEGFWGPTRVSAWEDPCARCFVVCAFQSCCCSVCRWLPWDNRRHPPPTLLPLPHFRWPTTDQARCCSWHPARPAI